MLQQKRLQKQSPGLVALGWLKKGQRRQGDDKRQIKDEVLHAKYDDEIYKFKNQRYMKIYTMCIYYNDKARHISRWARSVHDRRTGPPAGMMFFVSVVHIVYTL